jgi:hypothetical protein
MNIKLGFCRIDKYLVKNQIKHKRNFQNIGVKN